MNTKKIKGVLISALLSLLGAFVLIFTFSILSYGNSSPEKMRTFFGIVSLLCGGALCGLLPKLIFSDDTFSGMLITVGIYLAVILIASSINGGDGQLLPCLAKVAFTFLVSLLTFMLSSKQKKGRRRRKKRH